MNERKRPLAVTILACLYIVVGAVGFVYHLGEFLRNAAFESDIVSSNSSSSWPFSLEHLCSGAGTGRARLDALPRDSQRFSRPP